MAAGADAPVFVDTSYFVALLNRKDEHHESAIELARAWLEGGALLLTTDAVLVELCNFFSRSPLRGTAIAAVRQVRRDPTWAVAVTTADLFDRAEARYAAHGDKTWSLTDCIGMEAMVESGSSQVATTDDHFSQAGFRILLPGAPPQGRRPRRRGKRP
jgi:hypothetical protein